MLYNTPHFRQTDRERLIEALDEARFATLVSNSPDGPVISHLPLLLDRTLGPNGTLIGHVARANPHWTMALRDVPSVAIVHGPDAYVSPGWYPSKAETGKAVPTWNYTVIHATGRLGVHEDTAWLRDAVSRLTDRHERGRAEAWSLADAPESYIAAQLKGIVGISLEITSLEGKVKLSQNRSAADRDGVVTGLSGEPDPSSAAIRRLMNPSVG